jgi:hypothetical protein
MNIDFYSRTGDSCPSTKLEEMRHNSSKEPMDRNETDASLPFEKHMGRRPFE